jgi:hypothetical protein
MSAATGNSPAWRIKVIANPSVRGDKVSLRELKSVYLGKISSLTDGTHIEPVLAKRGLAHEDFLRQCLDQSNDQLQLYYRSLIFSGKGSMPKEVNSDAEMVAWFGSRATSWAATLWVQIRDGLQQKQRNVAFRF